MKKILLLFCAFVVVSCTSNDTRVNAVTNAQGANIQGSISNSVGNTDASPTNSVSISLPVGDSVAKTLFPNGFKNITPAQVEAAKEAVDETVPAAQQAAVENQLEKCGTALENGGKCSVAN